MQITSLFFHFSQSHESCASLRFSSSIHINSNNNHPISKITDNHQLNHSFHRMIYFNLCFKMEDYLNIDNVTHRQRIVMFMEN